MSARTARLALVSALAERGVSRKVVDDAALIVHELVTNSVDHGRPDTDGGILFIWEVQGDELLVLVKDYGTSGVVAAQSPGSERDHGRGLAIVNAVSDRWTVVRSGATEVRAWLLLAA